MCLISVAPKGSDKYSEFFIGSIKNGFNGNTDGSGFAIKYPDGRIYIAKGFFKWDDLIKSYKEQEAPEDSEVIVHSRIGTSGEINDVNCHPFIISEKQSDILSHSVFTDKPVVAHNGIFYSYTERGSLYSDTYHYVKRFLSIPEVIALLKRDEVIFEDLFSTKILSNKLAVLFPDSDLVLLGDFKEDQGYKFSNGGYCNVRIRNVGGVESFNERDYPDNSRDEDGRDSRVDTFSSRLVDRGFNLNHEKPALALPENTLRLVGSEDRDLIKDLNSYSKHRITELNFQDFLFSCTTPFGGLKKDTTYLALHVDSKEETITLQDTNVLMGTNLIQTRLYVVENYCKFLVKIGRQSDYSAYKILLQDLENKKIDITSTFYRKIARTVNIAKKDEVVIKRLGKFKKYPLGACCIFLDQYRYILTKKNKVKQVKLFEEFQELV
jgi:hypothetical protein